MFLFKTLVGQPCNIYYPEAFHEQIFNEKTIQIKRGKKKKHKKTAFLQPHTQKPGNKTTLCCGKKSSKVSELDKTWLGLLSLTWERYDCLLCLLWDDKGIFSIKQK